MQKNVKQSTQLVLLLITNIVQYYTIKKENLKHAKQSIIKTMSHIEEDVDSLLWLNFYLTELFSNPRQNIVMGCSL